MLLQEIGMCFRGTNIHSLGQCGDNFERVKSQMVGLYTLSHSSGLELGFCIPRTSLFSNTTSTFISISSLASALWQVPRWLGNVMALSNSHDVSRPINGAEKYPNIPLDWGHFSVPNGMTMPWDCNAPLAASGVHTSLSRQAIWGASTPTALTRQGIQRLGHQASRSVCQELVCITVKWTWYNGRDTFFHITFGRINTWKGVNQLKELFFLHSIISFLNMLRPCAGKMGVAKMSW